MPSPAVTQHSPLPHRLAVVLWCATFPLIWVGGLVTTYDAGMAVPDWPTTYGYNLFLYPWATWFFGPWDLFIEHGHRLLGAVVGLLTIAFCLAVWRTDERRWMRWMAVGGLALVILQGLLGGARVLLNDGQVAMIHGCLGPGFFAYCVALAVCTSARWRLSTSLSLPASGCWRLAVAAAGLAYLQIVLGALVRHVPAMASPGTFQILLLFHLFTALVLVFHIFRLVYVTRTTMRDVTWISHPSCWLAVLVTFQAALGAATWVVKYGWPYWLGDWQFAAHYTVSASSFWQGTVVTAHVAIGSLILAMLIMIVLRTARLTKFKATAVGSGALLVGVVT